MSKCLLVDDNGHYADLLSKYFLGLGFEVTWCKSAKEGYEEYTSKDQSHYQLILTDITMEGQISGLTMLKKIRKAGYKGLLMIASTGFDIPLGKFFTRLFFANLEVKYIIPKKSVLKNEFIFYSMEHFSKPVDSVSF